MLVVIRLLWVGPASADHASDLHLGQTGAPVETLPQLLRRHVPELAEGMKDLPPFLGETQVNLHLRTFYFNRENADSAFNEAWAFGGWLEYKSGWLLDAFRIGAVGYTSQPLYAPDDRDGTLLLGPGQSSMLVLGQAYAQLRYKEYALLTGYRHLVGDGYVNSQDNRMVPNTFEGVTLTGAIGPVGYDVGYLTAMKPRNAEDFVNMAEQAGVRDHNRGLLLTSLRFNLEKGPDDLEFFKGLDVYLGNYLVPDVYNTLYLNPEYGRRLTETISAQFGVQWTDQRSGGSAFLGDFATWNVGARAQVNWRALSFIAAMSATGADAELRSPYGSWPGYLNLIELDFDRANEKAWGVGIGYDWGGLAFPGARWPGMSMLLVYAQGTDARNAATGASLPTRREGDLDIIWRIRQVKGLQFRFRNAYADTGGVYTLKEFRIILDYELPLL